MASTHSENVQESTKILIVDDHPLVRIGMRSATLSVREDAVIEESGYLSTALEILENQSFDLILLDINLPDSAPDVLERVRAAAGDAKVLIVSMSEDSQLVRSALADGADGFLPKSASPAATRHAISIVLAGEKYVPSQILIETPARTDSPIGTLSEGPDEQALKRYGISPMQHRVLAELCTGKSNQDIADTLGIALSTVKVHVAGVIQKLSARNRTHAVLIARENNLV